MCGIAGHFAWRSGAPPVDRDSLHRTCRAMAARGPDGEGLWLGAARRVGLAHRRLAIIGSSEGAAQPMALDGDRLVIVFNGEIYNFRSLRRSLEAAGCRFRTAFDEFAGGRNDEAPLLVGRRPAGKRDLASTPAKPLPRAVLRRPKTGFGVPMERWMSPPARSATPHAMRAWARRVADECYA